MIKIVLSANDLDVPVDPNGNLDTENSPYSSEQVTRKTRRGILEAILRFHKRVKHDKPKFYYWIFRRDIFLCSAYTPTLRGKNFISVGNISGIVVRPQERKNGQFVFGYEKHRYYRLDETHTYKDEGLEFDNLRSSPLTQPRFVNETSATLQYLNAAGLWDFFPVLLLSQKSRPIKNNRRPLFGEVITSAPNETVYTLLLASEDLYDVRTNVKDWCFDSLQECLQSPVVYLATGNSKPEDWQRLAITTTDAVLHSDKPRAYITLEAVVVKEILDS